MEIELNPGRYVIAVSGGVDSMVLLDLLLRHKPKNPSLTPKALRLKPYMFVVAHFDHGIHEKSSEYRNFVATKTLDTGVEFVSVEGKLGPQVSEATARKARYEFLEKVKNQHKADAIITAHHRDDVVETVIINLLRGSGRKGMSSLKSTAGRQRPLLAYTKKQIRNYAERQNIEWREDPTNLDVSYLRNYVRLKIIPRLSQQQLSKFSDLIDSQLETNQLLEELLAGLLQKDLHLNRKLLIAMPHNLAKELLAEVLRSQKIIFDSRLLEKIVVFVKTAKIDKKFIVSDRYYFEIQNDKVKLNLL